MLVHAPLGSLSSQGPEADGSGSLALRKRERFSRRSEAPVANPRAMVQRPRDRLVSAPPGAASLGEDRRLAARGRRTALADDGFQERSAWRGPTPPDLWLCLKALAGELLAHTWAIGPSRGWYEAAREPSGTQTLVGHGDRVRNLLPNHEPLLRVDE